MSKVTSKLIPQLRFKEFSKEGKWTEKTLGEVSLYFKGFPFQSKDYTSTGRRIVRVSDMGFDYIKNETSAIYINEEKAEQFKKWELQKDDLIITTVGSKPPVYDSLVGRTIVVKSENENTLLNQNAVCIRSNKKIEQGFLKVLFKRIEYVSFIKSIIRGNANQGSIALEDLFKYKFFQPNLKEQKKIASCLSSLDELITAHNQKLNALKDHKKGLMQNLFPQASKTVPNLRFKEFSKEGKWTEKTLGEVSLYFKGFPFQSKDY
ncbi:MAG: restriction endonuclease subunit S, partial [Bacteroidia bacterium]